MVHVFLIVLQYILMLAAFFVGIGLKNPYGTLFAIANIIGMIVFAKGLRMLMRTGDMSRRLRGYRLALLALLPTVPLSLCVGLPAVRTHARTAGVLHEMPSLQTTPAPSTAGEQSSPQGAYYSRRMLGTYAWIIGLCAALIGAAILLTGNIARGVQTISTALIVLYFSAAYRKPRILVQGELLICTPNAHGPARSVPLSAIRAITGGAGPITMTLKDDTRIVFPQLEFSRATRARVATDIQELLSAAP